MGDLVLSKSRCSHSSLAGKSSTMSLSSIFNFDPYGDHIQTCQRRQSASLPAHEWIVYKLSLLPCSVGHRVKTHKVTPAAVNERGDIENRDKGLCHLATRRRR
jgi:hypothetical protein